MKISKFFAGMSALAMAATMAVSASAAEAPVENQFYNATGEWKYTYTADDIKAALDNGKAEQGTYDDGTSTLGFNIQVGHIKNAKVTLVAKSSTNNLKADDGSATNEVYFYTVMPSWNADAPADKEKTPVKFDVDENGEAKLKKGATDLNNWDSGPTKYNGQWAQVSLTDADLSGLTIEATVVADADSTWEYHAVDPEKSDEENVYQLFLTLGHTETVPQAEINAQIEGDDASSGEGEAAEGGESKGGEAVSGGDEKSSSGDAAGAEATGGNATGGNATGGSTAGGSDANSNAGTGSGSAAATTNTSTGSSAGLALAGLALAGAAIVATKKR